MKSTQAPTEKDWSALAVLNAEMRGRNPDQRMADKNGMEEVPPSFEPETSVAIDYSVKW